MDKMEFSKPKFYDDQLNFNDLTPNKNLPSNDEEQMIKVIFLRFIYRN